MVPIFELNVLVTSYYAPHYDTCQHSFDIQLHKEIEGYILSQISKISAYYNILEIHLPKLFNKR